MNITRLSYFPTNIINILSLIIALIIVGLLAPKILTTVAINKSSLQFRYCLSKLSCFGEPISRIPLDHPRVLYWKTIEAKNRGDWDAVISLMVPPVDVHHPIYFQLVGLAYLEKKNYPAAVEAWKRIGFVDGLLMVGDAAAKDSQVDIAYKAYYVAWEFNFREVTGKLVQFLNNQKKPQAAEAVLRESLSQTLPRDRVIPYWYRLLARMLMEQERWDEASIAWEKVLVNSYLFYPGQELTDELYSELAWAYHLNGQSTKAVDTIEKAVNLKPNVEVLLRAGQIYEAVKDIENAILAYRRVLAIDPLNDTALGALNNLEEDE